MSYLQKTLSPEASGKGNIQPAHTQKYIDDYNKNKWIQDDMTNNSEKKDEQQKRRLYIIHFDGCNHTRIVDAQYVHNAVHRIAGESFYICEKCETDELRHAAGITDLP